MLSSLFVLLLGPVTLKRMPKVDARAAYEIKAIVDLVGQDGVRFTGLISERTKSVEGETLTTTVESRVDIDLMGVARQGRPQTSDRIARLDGTLIRPERMEGAMLFAIGRIDRLRTFYFPNAPVEIGSGWWHTESANADLKAPPFAAYLKLEGEEKVLDRDVWRTSVDAYESDVESPVHVKGMLWLDKADGSLVRGQWSIEGFAPDPKTPAMKVRYELSRTAVKE